MSSATTTVSLFHDSIKFVDVVLSRSAWALFCVAGMRGVTVPGHRVCSWQVT